MTALGLGAICLRDLSDPLFRCLKGSQEREDEDDMAGGNALGEVARIDAVLLSDSAGLVVGEIWGELEGG